MNFVAYAWIGSVFYSFETLFAKLTSRYGMKNPWYFNFLWSTLILLMTIPAAFISGPVGLPENWRYIIWAGIFYGLANIFYILCIYLIDITTLSPLFNLRTAFSVLIAGMFLNEKLSAVQIILVTVIMLAGIFVNMDEKMNLKKLWNRGMIFGVVEMLVLSLFGVFIKLAMAENSYWQVTLYSTIIGEGLMLLTLPLFARDIKTLTTKQFGSTLLIAFASVIGTLAANVAYAENVSITTVIMSVPLSMIIAALIAQIKPGFLEHHTRKVYAVRFTAAAIMIIASIKLSA